MRALDEDYLKTSEVAPKLRRTAAEVSRMCKRGELRAVQVGRTWLIPVSAVEELLTPVSQPTPLPSAPAPERVFVTASQKRQARRQAS